MHEEAACRPPTLFSHVVHYIRLCLPHLPISRGIATPAPNGDNQPTSLARDTNKGVEAVVVQAHSTTSTSTKGSRSSSMPQPASRDTGRNIIMIRDSSLTWVDDTDEQATPTLARRNRNVSTEQ